MFLLTIALRVFTIMELVVRLQLQTLNAKLRGLYDGTPDAPQSAPRLNNCCGLSAILLGIVYPMA